MYPIYRADKLHLLVYSLPSPLLFESANLSLRLICSCWRTMNLRNSNLTSVALSRKEWRLMILQICTRRCMLLFVQTLPNRRQRRRPLQRREREFIYSAALIRVMNVILLTIMCARSAATEIVNFTELLWWLVMNRWKIQKLTYDERQAALVKRLNAINGEDEE